MRAVVKSTNYKLARPWPGMDFFSLVLTICQARYLAYFATDQMNISSKRICRFAQVGEKLRVARE